MTPEEYIEQLAWFIGEGRDEEAVEFAARFDAEMTPQMTIEQFVEVSGLMHCAETVVELTQIARRREEEQRKTIAATQPDQP